MKKNYTGDRVLVPRTNTRIPTPIESPEKRSLWPMIIAAILILGGLTALAYWYPK